MDAAKRKRLEQAGFRIGTVAEFLGLTAEESEVVEIKAALRAADRTRDNLAEAIAPQSSHRSAAQQEKG